MSLALKSNIFGLCSWWYGALWWLEAWHSAQSKAATTAAIQCSSKLPEQVEIQSWWLRNDVFIILDQCPDRADLGFPKPGTPANLKLSTRVMACVFQPLEVPTLGWTCSPGSSRAGQSNCTILWQASSPPSIDTSSSLQPTLSDFFLTSYMEDIFFGNAMESIGNAMKSNECSQTGTLEFQSSGSGEEQGDVGLPFFRECT